MKNQVSDAVADGVGTPPNLFLAERFNRFAKARPVLVQKLISGELEEVVAGEIGRHFGSF
jgi:hypothetical protein